MTARRKTSRPTRGLGGSTLRGSTGSSLLELSVALVLLGLLLLIVTVLQKQLLTAGEIKSGASLDALRSFTAQFGDDVRQANTKLPEYRSAVAGLRRIILLRPGRAGGDDESEDSPQLVVIYQFGDGWAERTAIPVPLASEAEEVEDFEDDAEEEEEEEADSETEADVETGWPEGTLRRRIKTGFDLSVAPQVPGASERQVCVVGQSSGAGGILREYEGCFSFRPRW